MTFPGPPEFLNYLLNIIQDSLFRSQALHSRMLVPLLLFCLAVPMGNAHPGESQPGIARLLPRQNTPTSSAVKPVVSGTVRGSCASNGLSQCGNLCYDSKNGDVCCDPSASYGKLHTPYIQ